MVDMHSRATWRFVTSRHLLPCQAITVFALIATAVYGNLPLVSTNQHTHLVAYQAAGPVAAGLMLAWLISVRCLPPAQLGVTLPPRGAMAAQPQRWADRGRRDLLADHGVLPEPDVPVDRVRLRRL